LYQSRNIHYEAGDSFERFKAALQNEILNVTPVNMLHKGIFENFEKYKKLICSQPDVSTISEVNSDIWNGKDVLLL
jgi:NADP-dependent aldehyde dehydrogenase